jgi:hypothetical protein
MTTLTATPPAATTSKRAVPAWSPVVHLSDRGPADRLVPWLYIEHGGIRTLREHLSDRCPAVRAARRRTGWQVRTGLGRVRLGLDDPDRCGWCVRHTAKPVTCRRCKRKGTAGFAGRVCAATRACEARARRRAVAAARARVGVPAAPLLREITRRLEAGASVQGLLGGAGAAAWRRACAAAARDPANARFSLDQAEQLCQRLGYPHPSALYHRQWGEAVQQAASIQRTMS